MERIEELVERLEQVRPESVREDARALVTEVLAFHAAGLRRLVDIMRAESPAALATAAKDPLVASLLDLHDLREPEHVQNARDLLPVTDLLKKKARKESSEAACDLCAEPAQEGHAHLFDVAKRELKCVCKACSLVMQGHDKLRHVPERTTRVASLASDDAWWTSFGLPIGIAFFVAPSEDATEVEVQYPGAAGTVVSSVPRTLWDALVLAHPSARGLEAHVEALLVNRTWGAREHWIVGIDRAYGLAGLVRERWRGFTGGDEVRTELTRFFADLRETRQS